MSRKDELVNVARLSKLFACSERQVQLFASRDGMPKAKHGLYHLDACVRWRIALLESQLADRSVKAEERNLDRERARDVAAAADLKEIKLRELRGELIPVSIYHDRMATKITTARQQLLNLPSRIAHDLVGLEAPAMKAKLRDGIHSALKAMIIPENELPQEANGSSSDSTDPGSADAGSAG